MSGLSDEDRARGMTGVAPAAFATRADGSFDPEAFFTMIKHHGHGGAIGLEYRAHGADWVEVAMPWRKELVGVPQSGILASGAIISLIDLAAGTSVWLKHRAFTPNATLDLRIDYLRPAPRGETVVARCRCTKITRQIAFVEGIAHVGDPEDPIARAALTFMNT